MPTVMPFLAALLATLGAPAAGHGQLQIAVSGGTVVDRSGSAVGIWANSPNVSIAVVNESQRFYSGVLHWHNVPAGSYLVSGRGVAEAATSKAGSLVATLAIAGGGRSELRLEPNLAKDYRFAVFPGFRRGLPSLPGRPAEKPRFAIQLGGTGVVAAMELAGSLTFPSYLLPGLEDSQASVRQRLGTAYTSFAVGPDRFLLLDNRSHSLGRAQLEWAGKRLQDFRLDGARRVFVFMHRPPVDPRRHVRNGLSNRQEARRLGRLLGTVRTAGIFAGAINRGYTRSWYGIKTYLLAPRDMLVVESVSSGLAIRQAAR